MGVVGKKEKEIWTLWILFGLGVLIHFAVADFSKTIRIWPDEMRYYDIAKSIFNGEGITFRDVSVDFQKLLYALALLPFFYIKSGVKRIAMISLLNCVLQMLAIFPLYGICRELSLSKWQRYITLILYICWPETMLSMTFMAENLYAPIFFMTIYLWLKWEKEKKCARGFVLGILCYAGYNTKEIFLAVLLAFIACEALRICKHEDEDRRITLRYIATVVGTFLLIHLVLKMTIFAGMGNSYRQMSVDVLMSAYNIKYMIYAGVYYLAACMIVLWILPVVVPLVYYKELSQKSKNLFCMASAIICIAIATIAYTISVREDLGDLVPRTHFRYLGPALFLYFIIFLSVTPEKKEKKARYLWILMAYIFCFLVYKGADCATVVDSQMTWWISALQEKTGRIWLVNACVALVGLIYLVMKKFSWRNRKYVLLGMFLIVCLGNNVTGYHRIYQEYAVEDDRITEVEQMNDFFSDKDASVLYLADGSLGYAKNDSAMDTYFTQFQETYFSSDTEIFGMEKGIYDLKDLQLAVDMYPWGARYDNIDHVDYIILENSAKGYNKRIEGEICFEGKYFWIIKNGDPERIQLK